MNKIIEKLTEIKEKIAREAKKWEKVTDYCIVCDVHLDDPTRFTCGHPQCNKVFLQYGGSAALTRFLEKYDVEDAEELEEYIEELQDDLNKVLKEFGAEDMDDFVRIKEQPSVPLEEGLETKGLLDDLEVDSIEEAREKVQELRDLIEEISEKLEGRKSGG